MQDTYHSNVCRGFSATASRGKARFPHARFSRKLWRFGTVAITRAAQLTGQSRRKRNRAMPLLAFPEQRFHPDLALVHGFLVGDGLLVALHPLHIVGKKGAVDAPAPWAFGTLCFYRTDLADRRISA